MSVELLRFSDGAAIFDPAHIDAGGLHDLLNHDAGAHVPGAAGRAGVRLVDHDDGRQWIRRRNHRGGWVGRIVSESYVWLGAERTRAFREWRLLARLRELDLPVPAPVAAVYRRRGLVYGCELITERLPGTITLARAVTTGAMSAERWTAVGACITRFHAHGVDHVDLNAHNILLDAEDHVHLLDFDRGRIRRPGPWTERNWARLRRSLDKITRQVPGVSLSARAWGALRATGAPTCLTWATLFVG